MSIYVTQGIILKRKIYRETSVLFHCLSEQFGNITVIAAGSYKEKSHFTGFLEPFNLLNLELYKNTKSEIYNLRNAGLIETYLNHLEYQKSLMIYAAGELMLQIDSPQDDGPDLFKLLITYCHYVNSSEFHPYYIFLRYILRLFTMMGIPIEQNCIQCGNERIINYDLNKNGFICHRCLKKTNIKSEPLSSVAESRSGYNEYETNIELSPETSYTLRNINNLNVLLDYPLQKSTIRETKAIILMHLVTLFHKQFHLNSLRDI